VVFKNKENNLKRKDYIKLAKAKLQNTSDKVLPKDELDKMANRLYKIFKYQTRRA
jgi:hypothetical protein